MLRSSPWDANVYISLILHVCLKVRCFSISFCDFFNVIIVSKMYKTESFSVVSMGGQHVDIFFLLKLFVKCTHSSQRRLLKQKIFDMFILDS